MASQSGTSFLFQVLVRRSWYLDSAVSSSSVQCARELVSGVSAFLPLALALALAFLPARHGFAGHGGRVRVARVRGAWPRARLRARAYQALVRLLARALARTLLGRGLDLLLLLLLLGLLLVHEAVLLDLRGAGAMRGGVGRRGAARRVGWAGQGAPAYRPAALARHSRR